MESLKNKDRNYGITNEIVNKGRKKHWNNERRYKMMY